MLRYLQIIGKTGYAEHTAYFSNDNATFIPNKKYFLIWNIYIKMKKENC